MIIITIIKPCSQATSTSSCMWRRWGSSPAQSLHSGYRRVGPSPGRKEVVKKCHRYSRSPWSPGEVGGSNLWQIWEASSSAPAAFRDILSRESNLRRPNLLKTSDDSPEGLDGGMACLVTTRVVCVRLKQNILRSNLSFSFRQCQNSHHEIVHPNVLLRSGDENAQFPAAEHSQPVQADHIGQTIPEK